MFYDKDLWEVSGCTEHCPETDLNIVFSFEAIKQVLGYQNHWSKQEYICLLMGEIKEGSAIIESVYLPEQFADSTSCEITEEISANDYIGFLHSHHDMGSFHSGTDQDHLRLLPLSLVLSNNGEMLCSIRKMVSCGAFISFEKKMKLIDTMGIGITEEEATKVKKRSYAYEGKVLDKLAGKKGSGSVYNGEVSKETSSIVSVEDEAEQEEWIISGPEDSEITLFVPFGFSVDATTEKEQWGNNDELCYEYTTIVVEKDWRK